jgi:hypothetical protein
MCASFVFGLHVYFSCPFTAVGRRLSPRLHRRRDPELSDVHRSGAASVFRPVCHAAAVLARCSRRSVHVVRRPRRLRAVVPVPGQRPCVAAGGVRRWSAVLCRHHNRVIASGHGLLDTNCAGVLHEGRVG